MAGKHVFLVDGSSYIFRAYHALPPLNRKSDGLQVNAVLGFCNMLWKLLRDMPQDNRPTHLAIIFDKSEVTFRNKLYPDYKAHRPPAPDDLIPQFGLIREAVRAFDLPCLEQIGFEADDLIATYVREAGELGATATIVSSDKDLMQLVTDRVLMYDTMKDRRIGIPEVIEKFGVPPEKVVEVQALAGDSVDNVPGVPGIGVKTAAQLITEYGDLDTLLARAGEIKQPKRREALLENAEKARISRQLVLLDDHVKLDVPLDELAVHEPDARRLIAFLKAMEFSTLTKRVADYSQIDPSDVAPDPSAKSSFAPADVAMDSPAAPALGGEPDTRAKGTTGDLFGKPERNFPKGNGADAQSTLTPKALADARAAAVRGAKFDRSKYATVRKLDELKQWLARAQDQGALVIGIETTSPDPMQADLCGISLALKHNEACYVPLAHKQAGDGTGLFAGGLAPDQIALADAIAALKPILEDRSVLKIGHNLKFDLLVFAQHGIDVRSIDDIMLISYVLDAGRTSHDLDSLAEEHARSHAADAGRGHRHRQEPAVVRHGADRKGDRICQPECRRDRAALARAEAAAGRRARQHRLRDAGAAAGAPADADGAARHLGGPADAVAALRRLRPVGGAARGRDPGDGGRTDQSGQPQAARRHHVRQDGPAGRRQDQDRRVVDLCADPRRARGSRPRFSEEGAGVAAGHQAEVDLYRLAAGLHQCDHQPRAHVLRAGLDHNRDGCRRTSRTCRTFRCAPRTAEKSARPSSRRPATSWCRPTIRRSSCGCWRRSPTSRH